MGQTLKIINYTYWLPYYGNKHSSPYGKITFINPKGKTITMYYEIGVFKRGYEVVNAGSLYNPELTIRKVK